MNHAAAKPDINPTNPTLNLLQTGHDCRYLKKVEHLTASWI